MPSPERVLALQGATNFRDLGGYVGHGGRPLRWRRVFRSDHLAGLTAADRAGSWQVALYGAALGAMAASAWASAFPRYRVGAGAMLFLFSDLLIFAGMGPLEGHFLPRYMIWPLYYLGVLLITTGVIDAVRKKEPELRLVK